MLLSGDPPQLPGSQLVQELVLRLEGLVDRTAQEVYAGGWPLNVAASD